MGRGNDYDFCYNQCMLKCPDCSDVICNCALNALKAKPTNFGSGIKFDESNNNGRTNDMSRRPQHLDDYLMSS